MAERFYFFIPAFIYQNANSRQTIFYFAPENRENWRTLNTLVCSHAARKYVNLSCNVNEARDVITRVSAKRELSNKIKTEKKSSKRVYVYVALTSKT